MTEALPGTPQTPRHTDVSLPLRYRHGWGTLGPYFAGLQRGELLGARCPACRALWVPPRRACTCGPGALSWQAHPGQGTVQACTQARSQPPGAAAELRTWVLVRFDGAQALALAQLEAAPAAQPGQRVQVVGCGEHPGRMPALLVRLLESTPP